MTVRQILRTYITVYVIKIEKKYNQSLVRYDEKDKYRGICI